MKLPVQLFPLVDHHNQIRRQNDLTSDHIMCTPFYNIHQCYQLLIDLAGLQQVGTVWLMHSPEYLYICDHSAIGKDSMNVCHTLHHLETQHCAGHPSHCGGELFESMA